MARRSTPRRILDERAFPIRVKFVNPGFSAHLTRWHDAEVWASENLGAGQSAHHAMDGYCGRTMAFYFCSLDDAARFIQAHPHLELADQTGRVEHIVNARQWEARGREPAKPHSIGM